MSPLLPIGVGASLAGGLLSGIGESKGLGAMADEQQRQGQEWNAENQNQQQAISQEINRRKGMLGMDNVAPALAQRQGALAGGSTLATGLGMNSADRAKVMSNLMPSNIVGAQGEAQNAMGVQNQMGQNLMGTNIQQSQLNQQDRARMYDQLAQQAGRSGQGMRQAGEFLQQAGAAGTNWGMLGGGNPGMETGGLGSPLYGVDKYSSAYGAAG